MSTLVVRPGGAAFSRRINRQVRYVLELFGQPPAVRREKPGACLSSVVELQVTDTFTAVKMNAPLPDDLFRFTPPADAKEVREFTQRPPPAKN